MRAIQPKCLGCGLQLSACYCTLVIEAWRTLRQAPNELTHTQWGMLLGD